jgi:small GTP-binding protein
MTSLEDDNFHFSFSLVVLGESATGKSSLIACTLPESSADQKSEARSARADHGVRCKVHTYESRGARYQIHMWEVPGAPRYLDTAARYASMAAGLLLVFDLTRRDTFERVTLWLEAVEPTSPDLPRVLVGNKADGEAEVRPEEAIAVAQKFGCKYFETSATRNEQVPEAFSSLIARIVTLIPNPPEPSLLLRKRIQIGKALAENKSFRAALFDM